MVGRVNGFTILYEAYVLTHVQTRNRGFDDRLRLLLAPFEQRRHHHLGDSSLALVSFNDLD